MARPPEATTKDRSKSVKARGPKGHAIGVQATGAEPVGADMEDPAPIDMPRAGRAPTSWEELPLIMTVEQVVDFLQVEEKLVRKMLNEKAMPGRRVGAKLWRVSRDRLRKWVEGVDGGFSGSEDDELGP